MISLVDPIDRVNPAGNEPRPGPRRRGPRFPRVGEEAEEDQDSPTPHGDARHEPPPPRPEPEDDDTDGRIDIRVLGRVVPTRQAFPGANAPHRVH